MPTTGKFPLIQIEAVYLTKTGLAGGVPCRIRVEGLHALATASDHQVTKAIDGTPYIQVIAQKKGKPIGLFVEDPATMTQAVYDSIVAEIDAVLAGTKTALDVEITNCAYGDFSIDVVPDVNPVRHTSEQSGTLTKGVSFHFLTT